jgi:hypothetical protein
MLIRARRGLAADEPIDEIIQPVQILHVEDPAPCRRREM